ncbi:unnamed protein product [Acanthoscelides obtectus]|uniref:Uncharacterized protein n=1 Tax=Acanthoscelides obtectus TaxID=200917 RepID=A0A9P0L5M4_ACAOB|nr:unnamed protein product [Acanthoscelides obtectus]CAK1620457.1 hypothetical protein AOBTE_LOCUS384 [Acanthoscelides obtectus]
MSRNIHPQQLQQQNQPQNFQQQNQQPYTYYTTTEYYNNLEQVHRKQEGDFSTDYVSDSDGCYSDHQTQQYVQLGDAYDTNQVVPGHTGAQAGDPGIYGSQAGTKPHKRPHTLIAVAADNYPQYYDVAAFQQYPRNYHNPTTCPLASLSQQISSLAQQRAFSGPQPPLITVSQPETTYSFGDVPDVRQHQYQTVRRPQKSQNATAKQSGGIKKYPITVQTPK